jgi:hypothetical protein
MIIDTAYDVVEGWCTPYKVYQKLLFKVVGSQKMPVLMCALITNSVNKECVLDINEQLAHVGPYAVGKFLRDGPHVNMVLNELPKIRALLDLFMYQSLQYTNGLEFVFEGQLNKNDRVCTMRILGIQRISEYLRADPLRCQEPRLIVRHVSMGN